MIAKVVSLLSVIIFSFVLHAQESPVQSDGTAQGATTSGTDLQAEFQSDLRTCSNERQQAELCCNDPLQCASGMSPETQQQLMQLVSMGAVGAMAFMNSGDSPISKEGLVGICSMLGALGSAGAGVNDGGAKVCNDTRNTCGDVCTAKGTKWAERHSSCTETNCPDAEFLATAHQQFNDHLETCNSLSVNIEAMRSQQASTGGAGQIGQLCAQMASMMPASKEEVAKEEPTIIDCNNPAEAANPLCIDCKADPENKACGKVKNAGGNGMGYADASSIGLEDFNTGAGIDGLEQDPKFGGFEPKASQSGTVSGQGGGIPGGGNDGGGFGSEEQQAAGGGYDTDILSGERGGGGYSASVESMAVETSGGFSGYGNGSAVEEDLPYEGMDLKKFLPGGAMDPSRRLAGALVNAGQINDKNANIFEKISQRMKAVCRTKRLKDCEK